MPASPATHKTNLPLWYLRIFYDTFFTASIFNIRFGLYIACLLYTSIGELSDPQQDIILLKYYHQMTFKEIAESFSIPVSTVKTRHTAALKRLFALWKEGDYHETEAHTG